VLRGEGGGPVAGHANRATPGRPDPRRRCAPCCLRFGGAGEPALLPLVVRDRGRILRVLESDWQDPLRCTNLEQAFQRAGVGSEDGARRRVAEAIVKDPRLSDLLRWHPSAYFLTNEERPVARGVLGLLESDRACGRSEAVAALAARLRRPEERLVSALDALRWVGFVEEDRATVRLSPRGPEFLEGVGFYFHEAQVEAERFNVNCFHDFVLLTNPSYRTRRLKNLRRRADAPGMTARMLAFLQRVRADQLVRKSYDRGRVSLRDACAHCLEEIRLTVCDARLGEVQPSRAWHVRGGGCGVNNLFCGPACAADWLKTRPFLREEEQGPVAALWEGG